MDVGSGGGSPRRAKRCWAQSTIGSMRGSPFQTAMSWAPGWRVPGAGDRRCRRAVRRLSHHPLGRWSGVGAATHRVDAVQPLLPHDPLMAVQPQRDGDRPRTVALPGHVQQEDESIRAADAGAVAPRDEGGNPPGTVRDNVHGGPPQRELRGAARLRRDGRCTGDLPVGQGIGQRGIVRVLTEDRAAVA